MLEEVESEGRRPDESLTGPDLPVVGRRDDAIVSPGSKRGSVIVKECLTCSKRSEQVKEEPTLVAVGWCLAQPCVIDWKNENIPARIFWS